jgi:CheY-like chemotaxis protein
MQHSHARPRILVIDDDLGARTMTAIVLAEAGYSPTCVPNVARALDRLTRGGADLVLTDLIMPGSSGLDLLRTLDGWPSAPPVIAITGSDDPELVAAAFELGAAAVLRKPLTPRQLEAAVAALARTRAAA